MDTLKVDMNISHLAIHKNISQETLNMAGRMYFYYFNIPPKRSSLWYTFYTRLYPRHSLRQILLAISSMDVKDEELSCSSMSCHQNVGRKRAMIEAVGEVLNLTFRDIGINRIMQKGSKGMYF